MYKEPIIPTDHHSYYESLPQCCELAKDNSGLSLVELHKSDSHTPNTDKTRVITKKGLCT